MAYSQKLSQAINIRVSDSFKRRWDKALPHIPNHTTRIREFLESLVNEQEKSTKVIQND